MASYSYRYGIHKFNDNNASRMSDVEVVQNLRSAQSIPKSRTNNSPNDARRHFWEAEARKRGIDTWSNTSTSLGYKGNVGYIRYKDGSTYHNTKVR